MEGKNQIAYRPNIRSEDDRTPLQHVLADELLARPRRTAYIAVSRGLAKEGVCQRLSLGGVGVPLGAGVLLLAQITQQEKLR